jgi:hypothetical protein
MAKIQSEVIVAIIAALVAVAVWRVARNPQLAVLAPWCWAVGGQLRRPALLAHGQVNNRNGGKRLLPRMPRGATL